MRVSLAPEERRNQIRETAGQLFIDKGFAETSVSDIVGKLGLAQGTFYYYYKSKNDVLEDIIDTYIEAIYIPARKIVQDPEHSPIEKLKAIADIQLKINRKRNRRIHRIEGLDIHQRLIKRICERIVPLQSMVIEEGIEQGYFDTDHPREITEIFTIAANFLFDPGIFDLNREERKRKSAIMIQLMEKAYHAVPGSLAFYKRLMTGGDT